MLNIVVDITPESLVLPPLKDLTKNVSENPLTDQYYAYTESLREFEKTFQLRSTLNPIDLWDNHWTDPMLDKIQHDGYPLRSIHLARKTMGYWELYSKYFMNHYISTIKLVKGAKSAKHLRRMRAMNFRDIDENGSIALKKIIHAIEYECDIVIDATYIGTYTNEDIPKGRPGKPLVADEVPEGLTQLIVPNTHPSVKILDKSRWYGPIDISGDVTAPNMRAWKNRIDASVRSIDVFTAFTHNEVDTVGALGFAMVNLAPNGYAYVRFPRCVTTALVSMIHLFSLQFEKTQLVYVNADNTVYICGQGFLAHVTQKYSKVILDYVETTRDAMNTAILPESHYATTMEYLLGFCDDVYRTRFEYYNNLFATYDKLLTNPAAQKFDSYANRAIDAAFPDFSKQWLAETNLAIG